MKRRLTDLAFAADRIAVPAMAALYSLAAGAAVSGKAAPRVTGQAASGQDRHKARAHLLEGLEEALDNAGDDAARAAILGRLERALNKAESYVAGDAHERDRTGGFTAGSDGAA